MIRIHSIETFGTHEGPGIRLVIFLQGCNFCCAYCHNPDTIPVGGGKKIGIPEIIGMLESERPYFSGQGGLSVSGGEPGLQAKELLPLFREAKKRGFHTVLDTNASLSSAEYRRLLKIADLALIDLKEFDAESHLKLSGRDNEPVLKNILFREKAGKPFWIRYVLVPGWSDNREHLRQAAAFLAPCRHLERLEILPYHNLGVHKYKELGRRYRLSGVRPPSRAELEIALKIFRDAGLPVFIRA